MRTQVATARGRRSAKWCGTARWHSRHGRPKLASERYMPRCGTAEPTALHWDALKREVVDTLQKFNATSTRKCKNKYRQQIKRLHLKITRLQQQAGPDAGIELTVSMQNSDDASWIGSPTKQPERWDADGNSERQRSRQCLPESKRNMATTSSRP